MSLKTTEIVMKSMHSQSVVQSPRWQKRRFRSTHQEEVDMKTKEKYFVRRGKRGVIYLQERHCGLKLGDCLGTTDERIAEIRRREIHISIERGDYLNQKTSFANAVKEQLPKMLRGKSKKTQSTYTICLNKHLLPWFQDAMLTSILPNDLLEYKEAREDQGAGESTLRAEIYLLRTVLKANNIDLKLPKLSWAKPNTKAERFLTEPELLSILCLTSEQSGPNEVNS